MSSSDMETRISIRPRRAEIARRAVRHFALALATLSCGGTSPADVPPHTFPTLPAVMTWTLVWSDEFDAASGTPVDTLKWSFDLGDGCSVGLCGWGNNEKEFYTAASENVAPNGLGQLAITARRATVGSSRYTSAKIKTKGKMLARPGRVEARIKLPSGQGLWPAFWMLGSNHPGTPWPQCGEIDIMENRGSNSSSTSSALHGPGYSGATPFARAYSLQSGTFADDFHVFAVEWETDQVRFYIDGALHYKVDRPEAERFGAWVFDQPFYVILNLAVGGNFDGDPKSDAIFPATMLIDYVRMYVRQ